MKTTSLVLNTRLWFAGTPALNKPIELWSQLDMLLPGGHFGSFSDFGARYCELNRYGFNKSAYKCASHPSIIIAFFIFDFINDSLLLCILLLRELRERNTTFNPVKPLPFSFWLMSCFFSIGNFHRERSGKMKPWWTHTYKVQFDFYCCAQFMFCCDQWLCSSRLVG